ncbi:MAG: LytTR family transcriptional regulator [Cyclobacteriaceae bacterium]|nr:LytTR family transcriptional regulator [Cyclobacteriaceae bacterium]UYN87508.1 MAG: LytTR family transcriptional regulator [Cyclobacteriaceae bacterium]
MQLAEKLNTPFPFYLNDDRKNLGLIAVITLFVFAFMIAFRSRNDLDLTLPQHLLFAGITFICLAINIILLPRLFPVWFDPVSWTVKKYIVLNIWHLVLIGIAASVVDIYYICPEKTVWENIIEANSRVVLRGIIPIALTTLFLRNIMLQETLKDALKANTELQKIQSLKKEVPKSSHSNTIILHSDTSETLSINLPDLLYVQADDNYSTVVWKNGEGIQKKLLRANLKSIESQMDNSFTMRCHRSYLVNINAIDMVSGNTNGYKLKILDTDIAIPVSRQKGKEVLEKISQWKNVMELS